jgi:hypothetical protein
VTVEQLITALCQFPPDRRVVVPGQEWGLADVGDVSSRRLAYWPPPDAEWGCWIPRLLHRADLRRERCVVLVAQPSDTDPRRPRDLGA